MTPRTRSCEMVEDKSFYAVGLMFVTDLWLLALKLILVWSIVESRDSKLIADGRAWSVDGRAQALVGPGLATPVLMMRIVWLLKLLTRKKW